VVLAVGEHPPYRYSLRIGAATGRDGEQRWFSGHPRSPFPSTARVQVVLELFESNLECPATLVKRGTATYGVLTISEPQDIVQ
jgi:hypothetical protein